MPNTPPIHPDVRIGHVHLKVGDLERALAFYCGVLGFQLTQRYGRAAAFISAGGYHHHIGLNTWESLGGSPDEMVLQEGWKLCFQQAQAFRCHQKSGISNSWKGESKLLEPGERYLRSSSPRALLQ